MVEINRSHDDLYLYENRYDEPKKLFQEMSRLAKESLSKPLAHPIRILDVGCAAGEFAYYLRTEFPEAKITAFDLRQDLVDKAKANVDDVEFFVANIFNHYAVQPESFDLIFCSGVLSIFDDFRPIIDNLMSWKSSTGVVVLHGLFNNYPVDVNIKYKLAENYESTELEAGWNIFSKASVSTYLNNSKFDLKYFFKDFRIDLELPKKEDILRSWTFRNESNGLELTNGLSVIQPHSILVMQSS